MVADYAIIIPARYASQRYPGKPLAQLRGASGQSRSLIERVWTVAAALAGPERTWVATDDDRIVAEVERFGGRTVVTPASCRNGTERCAAALAELGEVAPVIVNLQGDAPLTPASVISELVSALSVDPGTAMTTPAVPCSASLYDHLVGDQAAGRVGGTTVVFDRDLRALYFSKRVIPHVPEGEQDSHRHVHLHLGVYAYRPDALARYVAAPPSPFEQVEGLEQLRFLEHGETVRVVPVAAPGWDCIELNNPEDVPAIEAVMARQGIE